MKNIDKMHDRLIELGEAWADMDGAADMLEQTRKSVLAKLMNESPEKSMAAKESEALANEEYEEFIKAMVRARADANKARVRYDSAKTYTELYRTEQSTRRAEMKLI